MAKEEKDPSQLEWKHMQEPVAGDSGKAVSGQKKVPKRMRQIPECYFLPRYPLWVNLLFYGSCIAGGIGAGMIIEKWIKKKVEEDGGVIYEFEKK